MTNKICIVWFRQDLRLADNPALSEAVKEKSAIIPLYILDDENAGDYAMGGASRVWLHHSLLDLNAQLQSKMVVRKGKAQDVLKTLIKETGANAVYWNRCYEPWRVERDKEIKRTLLDDNIDAQSFNASLLFEPWTVLKSDGTPYKVFTPYFRKGCLARPDPALPLPAPQSINYAAVKSPGIVDDLKLLPRINWDRQMIKHWDISEAGAQKRLADFLQNGLKNYKEDRNRPDRPVHVSRLSPYLHFGNISPRTVWHATREYLGKAGFEKDADNYMSELGWREFSYSLLYYNPDLPTKPLIQKFENFPWEKNSTALRRWQKGQTGYPIVDAGMRELWATGYMHNRVRMIVASFLIKHLLLPWQEGERWFWDTLFDADLASNSASWQWVAGSGADAAPYFRIFNPITQGQKFDPDAHYVRQWVPELAALDSKYIHAPWEASPEILKKAGITLGKDYPEPIVDHKFARERALNAFKEL